MYHALKDLLSKYLPSEQADELAEAIAESNHIPIVISGRNGPTGKTTLCKKLRSMGYDAHEAWEMQGDETDRNGVSVTVTLNRLMR